MGLQSKTILAILLGAVLYAFISSNEKLIYPTYFPKPPYDFEANPLSKDKIQLGRVLFYDPILSKDSTISCSSCHSPYNAFAHTDHDLSHGINDLIGTRNAPALFNLAWHNKFMWDGAIHHMDMQALAPISHPKEMAEDIKNVVSKLQRTSMYPFLFQKAYGDSTISGERVLKALSQFQLTLVSANAKYDLVKQGKSTFTEQELKGYQLFQENCNACHTEPLFTNSSFANNGLVVDTTLNDFGRWMITKKPEDSLLFKVPSLRNLSYSYPYMHDGRFTKLHQVLQHYAAEIQSSPTLSNEMKSMKKLTEREQVDLISFLLTLNDKTFVFDKKHAYPRNILLQSEGY